MATKAALIDERIAPRRGFLAAAHGLRQDRVTAEVVVAMTAAGIPSIVLKGPSIARWLYPAGGRGYGDTDLMVPASEFAHAEDVLRSLGFIDLLEGFHPFERGLYDNGLPPTVESAFVRRAGDGHGPAGTVELHRNLPGLPTPDDVLWDAFSADTQLLTVGGVEVRVLGRTALALHIVIHAVQHRFTLHTAEDLRRAVAVMPADDWRPVAGLAARLGTEDILGYGLRYTDAGAAIANGLGLPTLAATSSAFWYRSAPRGSASVAELWAAPTWGLKLKWVRWTLVPSQAKIRYLYGIADPNPKQLASAYARRWREVAGSLGAAARAAAARRKSVKDGGDSG